jgi:hypothetical protein
MINVVLCGQRNNNVWDTRISLLEYPVAFGLYNLCLYGSTVGFVYNVYSVANEFCIVRYVTNV